MFAGRYWRFDLVVFCSSVPPSCRRRMLGGIVFLLLVVRGGGVRRGPGLFVSESKKLYYQGLGGKRPLPDNTVCVTSYTGTRTVKRGTALTIANQEAQKAPSPKPRFFMPSSTSCPVPWALGCTIKIKVDTLRGFDSGGASEGFPECTCEARAEAASIGDYERQFRQWVRPHHTDATIGNCRNPKWLSDCLVRTGLVPLNSIAPLYHAQCRDTCTDCRGLEN